MISGRNRVLVALFLMPTLFGCRPEVPPAPTGEEAYRRYCASCHGLEGKGDGPVAASLRRAPTDLTQLARRSGGRFDERYPGWTSLLKTRTLVDYLRSIQQP